MLRKIITIFILTLTIGLFSLKSFSEKGYAIQVENLTIKTGISLNESVPKGLMGTWRVSSKLEDCTNPEIFKNSSLDIWNLSKEGDVIKLVNPFSGAQAEVNFNYVEGNTVRFTKTGDYDKKKLTDTVEITLDGETFKGKNYLRLETVSEIDGTVIKVEDARYTVFGEKISGMSIF